MKLGKHVDSITYSFVDFFGEQPTLLVQAPGRINFIGEHTDYNNGFVLPAAINMAVEVAVGPRNDNRLRLYAEQYNEFFEVRIDDIKPVPRHWANYVLGVVDQLLKRGTPIGGFNMVISGNVPNGAGMSSSAAVECATVLALDTFFSIGLERKEMALLAQIAEHSFPNVKCGIMDQYASLFGKKNHAIKLDCRELNHVYIPVDLKGYTIVLFNSNVKHDLADSEYNTRKQECEAGVAAIKKYHVEVNSLRDVNLTMIEKYITDPIVKKRCEYVVKENQRLHTACERLQIGDIKGFGQNMFITHDGLKNEYDVSCPELDFLVEVAKMHDGVVGARMMGGGFGGCTINIVRNELVDSLIESVDAVYYKAMHRVATHYIVSIEDGAALKNKKL